MDKMSGTEFYNYVLRTFKRTDKSQEVYDAITDTIMDMAERFGFEDAKVEAYTAAGITSLGDYKLDLPPNFGRLIGDVRFSDGDTSWTIWSKTGRWSGFCENGICGTKNKRKVCR
jgi:hypothetical protein